MRDSNFIVLVSVADEIALGNLAAEALNRGILISLNREPDLNDELTAVVLEPGPRAQKLCASLPLMGRQVVTV